MTNGVGVLMKGNKIDVFDGLGTVDASRSVTITRGESAQQNGAEQQLSADKIILATGSVPFLPPFPGIDGRNIIFTLSQKLPL